ncbi:MAG: hypothetical protein KF749_17545 [Bacteroidetes bacterium]|nr:hypothetical protein [Bacteroidota bacterium]MCW5894147.1 hypothetical protein [Bacteroidota bacterium]
MRHLPKILRKFRAEIRLLAGFACCLLLTEARAQVLPFHTYSVNDGLLQSTVYSVFQDSKGFLWVGTQDGVSRFDGYTFTNFTTEEGLINNRVLCIAEDAAGAILLGTAGGASRFLNGRFESFGSGQGLPEGIVYSILPDQDGSLLMGTQKGLLLFDSDSVRRLVEGEVFSIYRLKSGAIWLGMKDKAVELRGTVSRTYGAESGVPASAVKCLVENKDGVLFMGTEGDGVFRKEGEKFIPVGSTVAERSQEVYALTLDDGGGVWAGTYGAGVVRYAEGTHSQYSLENGLPSKVVRSIVQDREGNMWFGTYAGVARLGSDNIQAYTTAIGLSNNIVMAIAEGPEGSIWFGTYGGGASRLSHGEFQTFDTSSGLPHNTIRAVLRDRQGTIWLGTHKGAARLSGRTVRVFDKRHGLPGDVILSLLEDKRGRIWMGTFDGGVCILDGNKTHVYDTRHGLPSNRVRSIEEDAEGNIWLGTDGGLSKFDGREFSHFTTKDGLANNTIRAIAVHTDGSIWCATDGGGISVYRNGSFTNYTTKEGLANNVCFFALEDSRGNMWIGTNKGISRFDGSSFKTYSVKDGLVSNEMNSGAALRDRSGHLWFGSSHGAIRIDPKDSEVQKTPPPTYITRLRVFDNDEPLQDGLQLSYKQNLLEFDFVAIHLTAPHTLEYHYMLEGIDDEWRTTTQRSIPYGSVPPGEYRFAVTARIPGGEWNPRMATLAFTISPPFWGTWWFRLTAAVLAVLVVGIVLRKRSQSVRIEQERRQEFSRRLIESQEAERKRIASGLHDSLGQNLLVLKNMLQQTTESQTQNPHVHEELSQLSELAQQSLDEVREISFDLHPHVLDRLGLRRAIETMVEKMTSGFPTTISASFDGLPDRLDHQYEIGMYRIVQEALSNVVKHSASKNASVRIQKTATGLELQVSDDGTGFDAETFLSRPPEQWSLGLVNIAERVRLLGGTYALESKPGAGTVLTVQIPLGN